MRIRFAISGVLLALAFGRPTAQVRTPNILLITLDTTRADRMGFLGSTRGLTPNLDALAHEAIVFTRAFSQAPITTVSHATLLTGTFPPAHRVSDFGAPLSSTAPYLPQLLHDAGYRTGAFVGSLILDPRNGTAPGFDRGFDVYDAGFRLQRPGESRYGTVERRGDDVVARAIKWIAAAPGTTAPGTAPGTTAPGTAPGTTAPGTAPIPQHSTPNTRTPWFAWVHLFDAHDPYDPPADLKSRFAGAPYDGEIAAADRAAARVIRAAGPDAVVIVAADHGEALGDHGEDTHGVFLYDAVLHVPLIVRLPRSYAGPGVPVPPKPRGGEGGSRAARVTTQVRLADVAPTVLDAVGIPVPKSMQGESLMSLALLKQGPTSGDRPVYAETDYPRQAFGWSPLAAWRADRFLLVRAPTPELYDVVADPGEARNLAASRSRVVEGMSAELEEFIRKAGGAGAAGKAGETTEAAKIDPELSRRLAALGYVSGSGAPAQAGVDPKNRIAIANALHHAVVFVEDGAFAKAVPLLEKVVASEPDIPLAQLQLGIARARQRRYAQAVAPLAKAATLAPEQMLAQYELGVALYETGDLQNAARRFEIVAAKMPKFAGARYSLGSVYARIDRVPDALRELHAAIDLEPRHFRANLLLGRILTLQHKRDEALPYLRTAVDVDPASAEARAFLDEALKPK